VKKKALRPLHTPGDTFCAFYPHAPLPATLPILKILASKAYHWIARNLLRTTAAFQMTHLIINRDILRGNPKNSDAFKGRDPFGM
jgi:hypothetical protein